MAGRRGEAGGVTGADAAPSCARRILVVSACSKRKAVEDSTVAPVPAPLSARDRYAGRAHFRVRNAIDHWRNVSSGDFIEWSIVSAGLGLVGEHDPVPHYEATFAGLGDAAARERAHELALPNALRNRLADVDVALFVLPLIYLRAVGAPFAHPSEQLYFASPAFGAQGGAMPVVPCGIRHARELRVSTREVAAARFASFVDDASTRGLPSALTAWGSKGEAA